MIHIESYMIHTESYMILCESYMILCESYMILTKSTYKQNTSYTSVHQMNKLKRAQANKE